MKRVLLFVITNLAVILVLSIVLRLPGVKCNESPGNDDQRR